MTEKELLALKAIYYGCNTNKRIETAKFVVRDKCNKKIKNEILFIEALEIMEEFIIKQGGQINE